MGFWKNLKNKLKESGQRNAALRTYMDEIENRVRRRLQESGGRDQQRIQEMFGEEIQKAGPIPGLSGSGYWDRTLVLSEMRPRVEALHAEFQGERT